MQQRPRIIASIVLAHGGGGEMTAEDARFTFASLAREGSASSLAPEFRLIKSMEVENAHTLTVRFDGG